MEATGIIFAGLDCDADSIEQWNRWYDLEHVPPNVSMPGIMMGHRYVATPDLHELRIVAADSGFANQRGTFLTIYTLCGNPDNAFADMTVLRDKLYDGNRMTFPPEKKAVREGDVMKLQWSVADPTLTCLPEDVPFVGHTSMLVVQRQGSDAVNAWYRDIWAPAVAALDGVTGVMSVVSSTREGLITDLVFLEGDAATMTNTVRSSVAHHDEATIVLDTPFAFIDPLRYEFAAAIRASSLPATVA